MEEKRKEPFFGSVGSTVAPLFRELRMVQFQFEMMQSREALRRCDDSHSEGTTESDEVRALKYCFQISDCEQVPDGYENRETGNERTRGEYCR
jgi:hypothetical protein